MRSLFVTGGTGFIGRRVLGRLVAADFRAIVCLRRGDDAGPEPAEPVIPGVRYVRGDLRHPETYRRHLAGCDTVLHLAAATGRVPRDVSLAVNAEGTRALIHECRLAGVRDFLFTSTIAVKYPNAGRYPYAEAKQLAEAALRDSGLRYVIVRPTIVVGSDAPIWRALAGLARRPVIVMPGRGRVQIQPIFVDDLVATMLGLVERDLFRCGVFELGGPEVASFEEFLRTIHRLQSGREPAVVLHLPLRPILGLLSLLEPVVTLPVTVGQLSAFRYDSTADPALSVHDPSIPALGLDGMIRKCLAHG